MTDTDRTKPFFCDTCGARAYLASMVTHRCDCPKRDATSVSVEPGFALFALRGELEPNVPANPEEAPHG